METSLKSVALILAKSQSNRLPNKNTLMFHGKPMFLVNVEKCLGIFEKVYVSSDSDEILKQAEDIGAIGIKRGEELCGEVPNIPVYQHAFTFMDNPDFIVAVQANSPTVKEEVICRVKDFMDSGSSEVITVHGGGKLYGSVWALSRDR